MTSAKFTSRRRAIFLEHLRGTANITAAAAKAKVGRSLVYKLRARNEAFRREWDEAMEAALDDLEAELRRRAVEGVDRPVFYAGKRVGSLRHYSDALGMFILRARRRQVFGEGGTESPAPQAEKSAREKIAERLNQVAEHLSDDDGNRLAGGADRGAAAGETGGVSGGDPGGGTGGAGA